LHDKSQVYEFISEVLESATFYNGNLSSRTALPNMQVFFEKLGEQTDSSYGNLLKAWFLEQEDISGSLQSMDVTEELLKRVLDHSNNLQNEKGNYIGNFTQFIKPNLKTIKYQKLTDIKTSSIYIDELIKDTQDTGNIGKTINEIKTEISENFGFDSKMISDSIKTFLINRNTVEDSKEEFSPDEVPSFDSVVALKSYLAGITEDFSGIYQLKYLSVDKDPRYDENALKFEINSTQVEDLTDRLKLFKSNLADNRSEALIDILQSLSIMVEGDFRADEPEVATGLLAKIYNDLKKTKPNLNFEANASQAILNDIDRLLYQNIINDVLPQASHENGSLTGD
jgi:hypothetical protein